MDVDARDPRVERTTKVVLDAVGRLLLAHGPDAVTFGRVSRETGVSRTTLYRHWPSPDALLTDAWSRVAPPNHPAHTGDLRADLVALFLSIRDSIDSDVMRRSLPALLAAARERPSLAELHRTFVDSRRQPIVDRLEAARSDGELPPGIDVELAVDLLSGPLFYRQLVRNETSPDEVVTRLVDLVLANAALERDGGTSGGVLADPGRVTAPRRST